MRDETKLPVLIAEDPLGCVVRGTGRSLEQMRKLKNVLSSEY